ncbi:MAG: hypothetical protein JTJ23_02855 [Fusicatenibacter saccharivorans]|uniref:HTH cro/C1-type domain-containing protein n=1 Tax=Fusicatenibacter saccharivorans TaxID=1150298 RepID=A0A938Z5F3_9FIRM|nr:hypothetical protein [Fusicatenibacter saccharivorans]
MGKRIVAIMGSMDNDVDMVSYVRKLMREKNLTLTDVAKMSGVTRQAIFDSLTRENTNYYAVKRVLRAVGLDIEVIRKDGKEVEFDQNALQKALDQEQPRLGKLKNILASVGYELAIMEKDEQN